MKNLNNKILIVSLLLLVLLMFFVVSVRFDLLDMQKFFNRQLSNLLLNADSKVVESINQRMRGKVTKVGRNYIVLEKDGDTLEVAVDQDTTIMSTPFTDPNLKLFVNESSVSAESTETPPTPPIYNIDLTLKDINVGDDLWVFSEYKNNKFYAKNIIIFYTVQK